MFDTPQDKNYKNIASLQNMDTDKKKAFKRQRVIRDVCFISGWTFWGGQRQLAPVPRPPSPPHPPRETYLGVNVGKVG